MNNNIKKLVTHNGSFHSDDIFATAVLSMMLERDGQKFEVIRTRDPELIKIADYVYDVGGIYDEATNRFDHHQVGGAGKRDNGIEYSSFGLVWKKFGKEFCGDDRIYEILDKKLVSPIDAIDNGIDISVNKYDFSPYDIQYFFYSMVPTWNEKDITNDEMFFESVEIAKKVLSREIIQTKDAVLGEDRIISIYNLAKDKRFIVLDEHYPSQHILQNFSEPLYVIYPRHSSNTWGVQTVRKNINTFENRKDLPSTWGGLRDEELQKLTGVSDAVFCHRALFLAVAQSKEGAIKLAQIALES